MEDFAVSGMRTAMLNALEIDGGIGHARISVRETVESANAMLTELLGVDPAAIRRVRFSALLPVGQRAAFAEALESVFRSGDPARDRTSTRLNSSTSCAPRLPSSAST